MIKSENQTPVSTIDNHCRTKNATRNRMQALRFWERNEALVQHMKLEALQKRIAVGAGQPAEEITL